MEEIKIVVIGEAFHNVTALGINCGFSSLRMEYEVNEDELAVYVTRRVLSGKV